VEERKEVVQEEAVPMEVDPKEAVKEDADQPNALTASKAGQPAATMASK
jgi:hypothetical protein